MAPGAAPRSRARSIGSWLLHVPVRYPVTIAVYFAPVVATLIAKAALGDDATAAEVERLGYGWPAFEDGRSWTLFTGVFVVKSLTISWIPSFSFFAVALLEHKARSWRTLVMFLGGQVAGAALALLISSPLRGHGTAWAHELTATVDFGYSVGGFAALGMWTGYLSASWRRPLRVGISLYLACQFLLSGLIFDVSHPIGWTLGVFVGAQLMRPRAFDRRPLGSSRDSIAIAVAVALGLAVGIYTAWNAGGVGGPFGWGPS